MKRNRRGKMISIDQKMVYSGKFSNMRAEAQLLYFYLAVAADDDGLADVSVACSLTGTNFIEVSILLKAGLIEVNGDDKSLAKVNGVNIIRETVYK